MKNKKFIIIIAAFLLTVALCVTLASCVKINTPQFNKKNSFIKMEDCRIQTKSGNETSINIELDFKMKTDSIEPNKFTLELNDKLREIRITDDNGAVYKKGDIIHSNGETVIINIYSKDFELLNKGYTLAVYYDGEVAVSYEMSHKI